MRAELHSVLGQRGLLARYFAVGVAALCLFAQLSSALHLLLVEHERCAEHGEWVHATSERHVTASKHRIAERSRQPSVRGDGHATGHEHCSVFATERPYAWLPDAGSEVLRPGAFASCRRCFPAAEAPGGDVYAFAPKTSPPAPARMRAPELGLGLRHS